MSLFTVPEINAHLPARCRAHEDADVIEVRCGCGRFLARYNATTVVTASILRDAWMHADQAHPPDAPHP